MQYGHKLDKDAIKYGHKLDSNHVRYGHKINHGKKHNRYNDEEKKKDPNHSYLEKAHYN